MTSALSSPALLTGFAEKMREITSALIKEKSIGIPDRGSLSIDVVKDVIKLVPVHFISRYLVRWRLNLKLLNSLFLYVYVYVCLIFYQIGIPLKTAETPGGTYREEILASSLADISQYVYLDIKPDDTWILHENSVAATGPLMEIIEGQLKRFSGSIVSFHLW